MRLMSLIILRLEPRASSRDTRVQHRRRVRTEERRVCTVVYPERYTMVYTQVVHTRHIPRWYIPGIYLRVYLT